MKMSKFLAIITVVALAACGGGKDQSESGQEQPDVAPIEEAPATEEPAAEAGAANLEISGNDAMQYDKKELRAKAGQKVILTLKHTGKQGKDVMGHNVVILKKGVDMVAFAEKAMQARETDYFPESEADKVIAHTKMIGGGESTTIEFTAPAKGTYTFLCSFPGHYGMMNGEFIVE